MRKADADDIVLTGRYRSIALHSALQHLLPRDRGFYQYTWRGRCLRMADRRQQNQPDRREIPDAYHWTGERLGGCVGISLPIRVCNTMRCSTSVCSSFNDSISLASKEA